MPDISCTRQTCIVQLRNKVHCHTEMETTMKKITSRIAFGLVLAFSLLGTQLAFAQGGTGVHTGTDMNRQGDGQVYQSGDTYQTGG